MLVLIGTCMAMLLAALDQTVVATAIPNIVLDLKGISLLSWVFTTYMLASTVAIPIYGKLSDIFDRKRLFILAIVIFGIGSILSGFAQNMTQLIFFRAIQGIGAGASMVNAFAVVGELYSPAERGKYQGIMSAVFGLATIIGPLAGGLITDHLSWRWVFLVNIPLAMIAIGILAATMPRLVHVEKDRYIDYTGATLIAMALVPLLLAFVWVGNQYAWASWQIITLFGVAIIALAMFIWVEMKAKHPIVALELFRDRAFTISVTASFMIAAGLFGSILYVVVFAQDVVGVTATGSGMVLLPMMIGLIVASVAAGQIISRTLRYREVAIVGVAVTAIGMVFLSLVSPSTSEIELQIWMLILGLGQGITLPVFTTIVQSVFNTKQLRQATAGLQLSRGLGATVGATLLGAILSGQLNNRLLGIENDPFINGLKQVTPGQYTVINANLLQSFINPQGQTRIRESLAQLSPSQQSFLLQLFDKAVETIKTAFSSSLDVVFLVNAFFMLVALVLVLFLPKIEIRTENQSPWETYVESRWPVLGDNKDNQPES